MASLFLNIADAEAPEIEQEAITIQDYALFQVQTTWSKDEWVYFDKLIQKESSWNSRAKNPNSTATGLGQFLDSTWGLVGCTKTFNEREQIDCTIKYISKVHGSPQKAWNFHLQKNWY